MGRVSKDPDERRSELLKCAEALFYSQGYESTSINDIVKDVGVAKGTFYYYFESKLAILEAMVEDLLAHSVVLISGIADDERLSAIEKWTLAFQVINSFKAERKHELLEIMRALYSDENILLLHKMTARSLQVAAPEFGRIIQQGIDEGVFATPCALDAARIVLVIAFHMSSGLVDVLLHQEQHEQPQESARREVASAQVAIERVLDAAPGSLVLVNEEAITIWFSDQKEIVR
jgi:AcrR family transcriptional regulator